MEASHTTIKRADLTVTEKAIVKSAVGGFMILGPVHYEFSNPSDLLSMHLFMADALKELDTYSATKHDVLAMQTRATEIFLQCSSRLELDDGAVKSKVKLYVFTDENEEIIEQVRAEDHDQAVARAVDNSINGSTDFYSTETIQ